jgi:phage pi2 protein 07
MKLIGNTSLFEVVILGRTSPNSNDEWDRRWIKTELTIKLNGFRSNQSIELLDGDFERFCDSIKESLQDFSKPIEFNTLEDSIYLKGIIQYNGQVEWEGYTIYPIGNGNKLSFRFETELAQVDNLYNDLFKEIKHYKSLS